MGLFQRSVTRLSILCLLLPLMASYGLSDDRDDAFRLILEARGTARIEKYREALRLLQESIAVAEEAGQKLLVAIALGNIAEIYRLHGNTTEALNHYRQALDIYIEIENQSGIATTRQQIAEHLPPTEETSSSKRDKLIREAIDRVKNRLKAQQKKSQPPDARESEYAAYLAGVKKAVVSVWNSLEGASRRKEEGRVGVKFTILQDGKLESLRISSSSGHASMDRGAIRAVKAAAPFHRIPEQLGLKQISIEFTFNTILEKSHQGLEKKH
ncbi:MAG: TonB family protein [Deltaproteobacteria bacterium]|nr:TonB family protein [Deltaproteobacteria bacterium]